MFIYSTCATWIQASGQPQEQAEQRAKVLELTRIEKVDALFCHIHTCHYTGIGKVDSLVCLIRTCH